MKTMLALTLLTLAFATTGSADPGCTLSCDVQSAFAGYVSPVTVVESGASVTWTSLDATHIQAQSPVQSLSSCFLAAASPASASPAVRFDFDGTTLTATQEGDTQECHNWQPLADGSALLLYFCTLHPNMQAVLIIQP